MIMCVLIFPTVSLVKACSVFMNGKEECDTGGMPPRSLTKRQYALLDEWLDQSSVIQKSSEKTVADGESKCHEEMEEERMEKKESSLDSGCITHPTSEEIFRERKAEGIRPETEGKLQEAVLQPASDVLCVDMLSSTMSAGDGSHKEVKRQDDKEIIPLLTQGAEHVSTNDNQVDTGVESCLALADLEIHPQTDSSDAQRPTITDCPAMDLGALLAETQMWGSHTQCATRESQADVPGWHFRVGHGLTDIVFRPCWQFPAISYYPALQESTEFEGVT